jgi:uncharacterized membrane protein YvbJ
LKENVIIGRLIPAQYKPLEEMVPAPVAAMEQVLDKMDEEISVEADENLKIDMSLDEDELNVDKDGEVDADAGVDIDIDDAADGVD